ncbi:MAG: alpha-glycosidase [Lachnospiraceae bacterium]|nr:alpha-glycosidase [Lachnospiraceae bacterium]
MIKSAVFHRTSDNFCYALDKDNLVITIRTGLDITDVSICFGDPYTTGIMGGNSKWIYDIKQMPYHVELEDNLLWSICITPEFKRCSYFFKISCGEEILYYFEDGFHTSPEPLPNGRAQYFLFPWMNPIDINQVPEWVNSTVWYQIFPDRFCNGDKKLNPIITKKWKGPDESVSSFDFYGGDIPGIISRLDYLKDLGITGLYLNPVCKAKSNHKYDTTDYLHIDPHFGTDEQMRELVDKAHSLGMKVMMDGVFNHCSIFFPPWKDVCKHGPESKYYDWFMINKWPFQKLGFNNSKKGYYYSFAFFDVMPKLNTNNKEVIKYFVHVCTSWIKKFDIDGIRFDVANEVSHEFYHILRKNLKKIKPDFFMLGELWHDSMPWLRGNELDSVMNYSLKDSMNEFWLNPDSTKDTFIHAVNRCYNLYMQQTNSVLFNLLDSHDTIRLISGLNNIDKFYQELAVLFTMPGSACIYYGTEIVLEGMHDPDCRRCMPWELIDNGYYDDRINKMKKLIDIRKTIPAARSNAYAFINKYENERIIHYEKYDIPLKEIYGDMSSSGNAAITVILNCSKEPITVENCGDVLFSNLFSENILSPDGTLIFLQ